MPLQQLMHNCTMLSKKEIEEIASSEEEETDEETRHLQSGKEKEIATETENEPVIDESPDKLLDKDWEVFDSLDKQFSTQWEGHNPNVEEPHEMTEIPQNKSPTDNDKNNAEQAAQILAEEEKTCTESSRHSQILNEELWSKGYLMQQYKDNEMGTDIAMYFIDDIHLAIYDNPKRFLEGLRKVFRELMNYCPHWNLRCWEQEEGTWEEHFQQCKHDIICQTCGKNNEDYHQVLQEVSGQQPPGKYFARSYNHRDTPWITCYNLHCRIHCDQKTMAKYQPQKPKRFSNTCPCWNPRCSCRGY